MTEKAFTVSEIRNAAFSALRSISEDELPKYFRGMRLLIEQLEDLAPVMEEQPKPVTPAEPEPPAPEKKPEPKPGEFVGYGAKLKRELYAKLLELRKAGVTMESIAAASGGTLTAENIMAMLNTQKLPYSKWEALEATLIGMGAEEP